MATETGRVAALARSIWHWMRRALLAPRTTICEDSIEVAEVGLFPWRDVLSLYLHKGTGTACLRDDKSRLLRVGLGAMTRDEIGSARQMWEETLLSEIRQAGYLDGTTVGRLPHPRRSAIVSLFLVLVGSPPAAYLLVIMHHRLSPLLGSAEQWLFLVPLIAGAVAIAAIFLGSAWLAWRQARECEEWHRWRIDRTGLSLPSPNGGWAKVSFRPGDRIGNDAVIGGDPVPIQSFSGGELSWKLLVGLGRRRGVRVALSGENRNLALRCLLLWVPLIGLVWLLPAWVAGAPILRSHWFVLLLGAAMAMPVGGAFLWLHYQLARQLRDIEAASDALLEELGW